MSRTQAGPPGIPVLKVKIHPMWQKITKIPIIKTVSKYLYVLVYYTCIGVIICYICCVFIANNTK